MLRTSLRLGTEFEPLEARTLPTIFGVPWADPGHLTLSFAPDGTPTPAGPSSLFATLNQADTTTAWQREILRAFQTWAVNANINVGLVPDGGQAIGTTGAVQGDSRFGDARITAAPLDPALVASASPFSWTGTTFSGDVFFNSGQTFRVGGAGAGYDVFSVALHEAGHVFGLDHDGDDTAMNAGYVFSTGLSAAEIADLQTLYGARGADASEGDKGNDVPANAVGLRKDPAAAGRYAADGDLTTMADVDFFKFNAASSGTAAVRLQAKGLSLLLGKVTVYNSAGAVVASGSASDVQNNDVVLQLGNLKTGSTYSVKVERATGDVFGIGGYRLTVDTASSAAPPPASSTAPVLDAHTNDTLSKATDLVRFQKLELDDRFDVLSRGMIEDATDADFYKVSAPKPKGGGPVSLNVVVWTTDTGLSPRARVYDAAGNAVAFRVLANEGGLASVCVPNAVPGGIYRIQVSAGNAGGTGAYFLGADFNTIDPAQGAEVGNNTLSSASPTDAGMLTVRGGGFTQFALSAEVLSAGSGGVTLTVTDAEGQVVASLDATAGDPAVTATSYLAAGNYTLRYTYRSVAGRAAAAVRYHLALLELSEGVGTYKTTASTSPTNTTPTANTGLTYTGSSGPIKASYWYFL